LLIGEPFDPIELAGDPTEPIDPIEPIDPFVAADANALAPYAEYMTDDRANAL
jgi:hypothetical protein